MKTVVNRVILTASIAIIAGYTLTYAQDYRWIGHTLAGSITIGFLTWTVIYGLAQAGRLRQVKNPDYFILHRKLGISFGAFTVAAFLYGLLIMLPQNKVLMGTWHGVSGLILIVLSLVQIIPRLTLKSSKFLTASHRWIGYLLSGFVVFQIILGIILLPMFISSPPPSRISAPWIEQMQKGWLPDGIISPGEYYASAVVDNGNYEIQYRNDGKHFYVGIKAKTTGWVGVGIEADQGMKGAGMVYGYVIDGKVTVLDSFGSGMYNHSPDSELGGSNDIVEFGGKEEGGLTVIEFKMTMFTGDKYDVPLTEGVHKIIWAYGATDTPEMHIARGHLEVTLESPK